MAPASGVGSESDARAATAPPAVITSEVGAAVSGGVRVEACASLEVDGATLELDFLRVGRISLMYQSVDGKVSGVWNQKTQSWEDAQNSRNQIKMGLRIAKKMVPPDLVILPVDSPEAI